MSACSIGGNNTYKLFEPPRTNHREHHQQQLSSYTERIQEPDQSRIMCAHLTFAHFTLPEDCIEVNSHVDFLDHRRVILGSKVFEFDQVFVPMSLNSMFREGQLNWQLGNPFVEGRKLAMVYYGEDAADKDTAEFLYQCGKSIRVEAEDIQIYAYGFYQNHRVELSTPGVIAKSTDGIIEVIEEATSLHDRLSRKARGRSHAVFQFESAGLLTVFLVDGLPNQLRLSNRKYRLTTLVDDAISAIDRPQLPHNIWRAICENQIESTDVCVVLHCPLAAEHRYALADSLRFGEEFEAYIRRKH